MASCLVPFLVVGDILKRSRLAARDKRGASPAGEGWLLLEVAAEIVGGANPGEKRDIA